MTNFSKPHPLATLSAGPPRALGRPLPGPAKPSRPVCSHSRTRTGSVSPRVYFFSDKDPSLLRCCREEPGRAARTREPGPRLRPRPARSCAPGGGDGSGPFPSALPDPARGDPLLSWANIAPPSWDRGSSIGTKQHYFTFSFCLFI